LLTLIYDSNIKLLKILLSILIISPPYLPSNYSNFLKLPFLLSTLRKKLLNNDKIYLLGGILE